MLILETLSNHFFFLIDMRSVKDRKDRADALVWLINIIHNNANTLEISYDYSNIQRVCSLCSSVILAR